MKRKFCFTLLFVWFCGLAFAQQREISGRVTSAGGQPMIGATITIKGSNTSTATDAKGDFKMQVPEGNVVLVISSIGFATQEVDLGTRSTVAISMKEEASNLNDVVVIGYQSIKRRDLTSSVSSVTSKQLKDIPLSNAAEALVGKLAGVQITSTEGAPGADIFIRVRGGSSITQDNSPLYIVDGVVVENALSVISPQDIASVDVLKDASSTAIYGARGANGVVIITTKSGRPGKTQVSFNTSVGFKEIPNFLEVLTPYEFVAWQWERNRWTTDSTSFMDRYDVQTWDDVQAYKNKPFVNWQDEVFGRKAKFQNHNVSLSGGSQNTTFNLSLTANNEEGAELSSLFKRYIVNFKLEHRANDKLRIGMTARYVDQKIDGAGTTDAGTKTQSRFRYVVNYEPFLLPSTSIDDFDETLYGLSGTAALLNPVVATDAYYKQRHSQGTYLTGFANYEIIKNLVLRSTVGFDNVALQNDQFWSRVTSQARLYAGLPVAQIAEQKNNTLTNSNTLQYSINNLNNHHTISVLAGQEILIQKSNQNTIETRYFPAEITPKAALANMQLGSVPVGSTAQQPLPTSFVATPYKLFSVFGRVNYSYDDKYLFNFNIRMDQSSKFDPENSAAVFPSGSVAWRISREAFMQNIPWISDAKIRFGYGAVGNDRIANSLYLQLYGVSGQYALNHTILPGFAPRSLANPRLTWETNVTRNLGIDLDLFRSRINLTVDIYKNTARDLLFAADIPPILGYSSQIQNIGSTSNRGVEIQLNAVPVTNKDFTWNSNFNISFNKNRVESLGGIAFKTQNSGWQGSDGVDDYIVKVGSPVGQMYGFITDGFYTLNDFDYNATAGTYTLKAGVVTNPTFSPQPGTVKWKDLDGDGAITPAGDRTVIGDANPKFSGGWFNQFRYKGFDLSAFVNFVVGNDVYNANKIELTDGNFPYTNMLAIMRDRWINIDPETGNLVTDPATLAKINGNATIWSPLRQQRWWLHSWQVEDGSYIRLNNITLGYTLPQSLLDRIKISTIRVFATVNNLKTITNYSGFDPDVSTRSSNPLTPGVDFAAYPRARTWVAGVNVTF
ncbi:MAG TPA: TonB-dependent receptor [Chitinophagaceae bacterium]|nr:TonB-dependent receptor [Chitinophagaceae bacterium]